MKSKLNTIPPIKIIELPVMMGRTKIPHVFSRSGDGYIEKVDALTKMKYPKSMFSGPTVV